MSLVPVKSKVKLPLPTNQSGSSCPNLCPKQGWLKQVSWDQGGFDWFQTWRLHNLLRQPLATCLFLFKYFLNNYLKEFNSNELK